MIGLALARVFVSRVSISAQSKADAGASGHVGGVP